LKREKISPFQKAETYFEMDTIEKRAQKLADRYDIYLLERITTPEQLALLKRRIQLSKSLTKIRNDHPIATQALIDSYLPLVQPPGFDVMQGLRRLQRKIRQLETGKQVAKARSLNLPTKKTGKKLAFDIAIAEEAGKRYQREQEQDAERFLAELEP